MAQYRNRTIGDNYPKVTCEQCKQEVPKRRTKALEPPADGAIIGYTTTPSGKKRGITWKKECRRVCKNGCRQ